MATTLGLVACSAAPITVTDGSVSQKSWEVRLTRPTPAALVLVMDDAPTDAAQTLRDTLTPETIAPAFDWLLARYPSDPTFTDPGTGVVKTIRVFVVHPSTATVTTPLDDPALALDRVSVGPPQVAALAAATALHVGDAIAPAGAAYPLLHATRDFVALVAGERPPRDAREAAVVATFPSSWRSINVAVVTARDDASPEPLDELLPPASEFSVVETIVDEPCTTSAAPSAMPRLEAWTKAIGPGLMLTMLHRGWCQDSSAANYPLVLGGTDYVTCLGAAPVASLARDASGAAECTVTFDATDLASCDPARGWADPRDLVGVRRPYLVEGFGVSMRRCEIVQLSGAARANCESSVDCAGCAPGLCFTGAVPTDPPSCPAFLRLVGGASPENALLHFTCNMN